MSLTSDLCSIGFNDTHAKLIGDALPNSFVFSDWTPSLEQSGAVTKTVNRAKYLQVGKLVFCYLYLSITGTGTASNEIIVGNLPVTGAADPCGIGAFRYLDFGTTVYAGTVLVLSTYIRLNHDGDGNPLGVTAPTCANGDDIIAGFFYEAA